MGLRTWARRERPWYQWLVITVVAGAALWFAAYAALVLALFAWFATGSPYFGKPRTPFSSAAWHAAGQDHHGARYLMLDDLLERHPLEGRSRAEVEVLLGPTIPPSEYPGLGWCYYLGPEPSAISIDFIWLCFEFDDAGRVVRWTTPTD